MYIGSKSIVAGNIWVVIIPSIADFFPINLNRDKAYPAVDARATPVIVTTKEINVELKIHLKKSVSVKRRMYESKVASSGIISSDVERSLSPGLNETLKTFIIG